MRTLTLKSAAVRGPAGTSAYQAAVAGGFSGTEASFNTALASLPLDAAKLNYVDEQLHAETKSGELFDASTGWREGYLGINSISNNGSSGDIRTKTAARVYKGQKITVSIAQPKDGNGKTYFRHVFVKGENDPTYVSSRVDAPSNGATNKEGTTYNFYEAEITIEDDGWLMCSYRPNGLAVNASSIAGLIVTNRLNLIESAVADDEASIKALQADAATNLKAQFPSDDLLPICSAHRGMARSGLPENTLPALAACAADGWPWVETDARLTSDGKWVCLHDATINRTARNEDGTEISGDVAIADITLAQAQAYDFGIYAGATYAGTEIMTLEQCVAYCHKKHLGLQIDIKSSSWTKAQMLTMWDIVTKYGMERRTMLAASSIGCVDDILAVDPHVPVAIFASSWTVVSPSDYPDTKPYAAGAMTGKNKVYIEVLASSFTNKTEMDGFVDYFRFWNIYPGVYGPVSASDIEDCSDRIDIACTQYVKYDEAKAAEIYEEELE